MFSDRLKKLRKEKGWTQKQLAEKLFIDQTTVSYWERGKNNPDFKKQQMLADLFEVSIDYLLGRTEDASVFKLPEVTKDDDGLIFSINGSTEKINLNSEQMNRVREILRLSMPEEFDKKSGDV